MQLCVLAFHYPVPEHRAEMVERIKRAVDVMTTCPGFVAADCWLEQDGDAVGCDRHVRIEAAVVGRDARRRRVGRGF